MGQCRLMLLSMQREASREVPLLRGYLVKASDLRIARVLVVLVAWTSTLQKREIPQSLVTDQKITGRDSKPALRVGG
jgi:hypothetical protein